MHVIGFEMAPPFFGSKFSVQEFPSAVQKRFGDQSGLEAPLGATIEMNKVFISVVMNLVIADCHLISASSEHLSKTLRNIVKALKDLNTVVHFVKIGGAGHFWIKISNIIRVL